MFLSVSDWQRKKKVNRNVSSGESESKVFSERMCWLIAAVDISQNYRCNIKRMLSALDWNNLKQKARLEGCSRHIYLSLCCGLIVAQRWGNVGTVTSPSLRMNHQSIEECVDSITLFSYIFPAKENLVLFLDAHHHCIWAAGCTLHWDQPTTRLASMIRRTEFVFDCVKKKGMQRSA